jgi:hypothetical protein
MPLRIHKHQYQHPIKPVVSCVRVPHANSREGREEEGQACILVQFHAV